MQAYKIEAERERRADGEDHQELQPCVGAETRVDREKRAARPIALLLGCEPRQELDHPVPLGDPVPRRREREEDGDDRVGRRLPVRCHRVYEIVARRKPIQVAVEPGEDIVLDPAPLVMAKGGLDLAHGRRHGSPEEESDHGADRNEERENRGGLREAVALQPLDSWADRRGEGQGEQQQDHHVSHAPEGEPERSYRE